MYVLRRRGWKIIVLASTNLVLDDAAPASREDPVYSIRLGEHRTESQGEPGRQ